MAAAVTGNHLRWPLATSAVANWRSDPTPRLDAPHRRAGGMRRELPHDAVRGRLDQEHSDRPARLRKLFRYLKAASQNLESSDGVRRRPCGKTRPTYPGRDLGSTRSARLTALSDRDHPASRSACGTDESLAACLHATGFGVLQEVRLPAHQDRQQSGREALFIRARGSRADPEGGNVLGLGGTWWSGRKWPSDDGGGGSNAPGGSANSRGLTERRSWFSSTSRRDRTDANQEREGGSGRPAPLLLISGNDAGLDEDRLHAPENLLIRLALFFLAALEVGSHESQTGVG